MFLVLCQTNIAAAFGCSDWIGGRRDRYYS
jgi:hypothetical protein